LSPHYQDALPHGGFNPNNLYSSAYEQREPGPGADGDPFTGRRAAHNFFKGQILDDIEAKMAAANAAADAAAQERKRQRQQPRRKSRLTRLRLLHHRRPTRRQRSRRSMHSTRQIATRSS
jgi:hypothetical protein